MKRPFPNLTYQNNKLTFIEVKNRQSTKWRRYPINDISRIDWDKVDAARALYAKVGGFGGGKIQWHYDIVRL